MISKTFFTHKFRRAIVHFGVLIIIIKFLFIPFIINSDFPARNLNVYTVSILIISFYVHSFLLLPILLKKHKPIKYTLITFFLYLLINFYFLWIEAIRLSEISLYYDLNNREGIKMSPLDVIFEGSDLLNHFSNRYMFLLLAYTFIPYWLFSFVYYILTLTKERIKKIFALKYTEFVLNVLVIASVWFGYSFSVKFNIRSSEIVYFLLFFSIFYTNVFLLTPILIRGKNVPKYVLFQLLHMVLYILLANWVLSLSFIVGFFPVFLSYFIIFVLSFIYGYVRIKLKAKEQLFNLKLGAKESELQLLKSQVNPHFLFNTLNTLYATALEENASKTAESTAKLASLIRYMQEDINKDFIPLENEINYLKDYITIQKLRCAVEPDVETNFKNVETHRISPGLLIPFVENAFKYGMDPSKPSNLKVSVICEDNMIQFECVNSYDDDFKTYYKEQGFGIGITNAKQRLELVYPKSHTFEVKKESNIFSVKIEITIKDI